MKLPFASLRLAASCCAALVLGARAEYQDVPGGTASAAPPDPFEECLEVPKAVCFRQDSGLSVVVGAAHTDPDLKLWYQFDKSLPVDESGNARHLVDSKDVLDPLPAGPGILGRGASAALDGRSFRMVRATDALNTPAWTVTLWLYLREDSTGSWRTIFCRGAHDHDGRPAVMLAPRERRLHFWASADMSQASGGLASTGPLPLRRWTHVALTYTGCSLRMFINGVLDGEVLVDRKLRASAAPLYIGRDKWRAGSKAYLDDFRWYSRELTPEEVRAMLYPGVSGIGSPASYSLACASCRYPEAVESCANKQSNLCTLQDLQAGGYHAARAMGWLSKSGDLWYMQEGASPGDASADAGMLLFQSAEKLGMCCSES